MSDQPLLTMNPKIFDALSMATDLTSVIPDIMDTGGYAVHAIWTGSPVGDIVTEGSNDAINFVPVNTQATGGADGQHLLNVEKVHYRYVRVRYVRTSGTGSLTCFFSSKRV